ncbi:MAG: VanZ family protein, partial [Chloroflexota bacterium]
HRDQDRGRQRVGDGRRRQGWVGFVRRWGPVVAWMATIFFFSSQSEPLGAAPEGPYQGLLGRLSHVGEYAVLAVLLYRALANGENGWRAAGVAFATTLAYAVTDELHQWFVPGRECSLMDLGYDALGAAAALLIVRACTGRRVEGLTQGRQGAEARGTAEGETR